MRTVISAFGGLYPDFVRVISPLSGGYIVASDGYGLDLSTMLEMHWNFIQFPNAVDYTPE